MFYEILDIGFFLSALYLLAQTVLFLKRWVSPPDQQVCLHCGAVRPTRVAFQGSARLGMMLWLLLLAPGAVYGLWRLSTGKRVCAECGHPRVVRADSPAGRASLSDARSVLGDRSPRIAR